MYNVSMLSALNGSAPKVKRSAATSSDGNGVYAVDGVAPPRRDRMVRMSQVRDQVLDEARTCFANVANSSLAGAAHAVMLERCRYTSTPSSMSM